jgi:hypothetical protein
MRFMGGIIVLASAAACAGGAEAVGTTSTASELCGDATQYAPIRLVDATSMFSSSAPGWRVAVSDTAEIRALGIRDADDGDAGFLIDDGDTVGFAFSRAARPGETDVRAIADQALEDLAVYTGVVAHPLGERGDVGQTADGFPTVANIGVSFGQDFEAGSLRFMVIRTMFGVSRDVDVPDTWSGAFSEHMTLQVVYRPDRGQVVFIGAASGAGARDLADGSALRFGAAGIDSACTVERFQPSAPGAGSKQVDVVWVVDDSGSMANEREYVVADARAFALQIGLTGLDVRLGVTDMERATDGAFALRDPDGRHERWMRADERELFAAAIDDPSGPAEPTRWQAYGLTAIDAVLDRHLPRDPTDSFTFRPDATVAFVVVSDGWPEELADARLLAAGTDPTPEQAAEITELVDPTYERLRAERISVHLLGNSVPLEGGCPEGSLSGGPPDEPGFGYDELVAATGGTTHPICDVDHDAVIEGIVDDLAAAKNGPAEVALPELPIASTITVSIGGAPLVRSNRAGWQYDAATNSIRFAGLPAFGAPPEIEISYWRWAD